MRLVITEKPSVARDIAKALGVRGKNREYLYSNDMVITWCVGHLAELVDPAAYDKSWKKWQFETLPMLPSVFKLRARKGVADRFKVVKQLLKDKQFKAVINGCDAGREGELIFRNVYRMAGSKLPVERLWIASMTDKAIKDGFNNLTDGATYDPLGAAAQCRSEADWLVGLNATRAMTLLVRKGSGESDLMSVGRVQTPTLAMLVKRDLEIADFVPETFYRVGAQFQTKEKDSWFGYWFDPKTKEKKTKKGKADSKDTPKAERIDDKAVAEQIVALVSGKTGIVTLTERKDKKEKPPLLYDLTSLQRRANSRYGLSAAATLKIAQELYEREKIITYPRTDSCYLTDDQVPTLKPLLNDLCRIADLNQHIQPLLAGKLRITKRVVNSAEVGDHHAIIPTGKIPNRALRPDQARIYDLITRRFVAVFCKDALIQNTRLVTAVAADDPPPHLENPLMFRAKGRVVAEYGWRAVDPPTSKKGTMLPLVQEGQEAEVSKAKVAEGKTRPPSPHNDSSILRAMETAGKELGDKELARAMRRSGLGTPATRAAIIQTLLSREYAERKGRALLSTEKGRVLIGAIPVKVLLDAELTGRWESRLAGIAESGEDPIAFMDQIREFTEKVVRDIEAAPAPKIAFQPTIIGDKALGNCPLCQTEVFERRNVYKCSTQGCGFVAFKKMAKREISPTMINVVLKEGKTKPYKGFISKKGKPFEAGLTIEEGGRVGFWFPERTYNENRPPRASPVGMPCPQCRSGAIIKGRTAWGCDQYRAGCHFRVLFERDNRQVTEAEAIEVILGEGTRR